MKHVSLIVMSAILLSSCDLLSETSTTSSSSTTTPPNTSQNTISSNQNQDPLSRKAKIYPDHPNASALIKDESDIKNDKSYWSLDEALRDPANVYEFFYSVHEWHKTISPDIGKLYNLQKLTIVNSSQGTIDIPIEIGKLKNLQYLIIIDSLFKKPIPAEIENLQHLKRIELQAGSTSLPSNFLDNLHRLPSLSEIVLSGPGIKRLPINLNQMTALTTISVKNAPNFTIEKTETPAVLKNLLMGDLNIQKIPDALVASELFSFLSISNCKNITEIPADVLTKFHQKKLTIFVSNSGLESPEQQPLYSYSPKDRSYIAPEALKETKKEDVYKIEMIGVNPTAEEDKQKLWESLDDYPNLDTLEMYETPPPYIGGTLENLKFLKFMGISVKDNLRDFSELLNKAPQINHLFILDACSRVPKISVLKKLDHLEIVDYNHCKRTKESFSLGNEFINLKNLKYLHIASSFDKPFKISNSINTLTNLEELVLYPNIYGKYPTAFAAYPDGIEALTKLKKVTFTMLDALPKGLEKLTQIEELSIYNCKISLADMKSLKAKMPNTLIKYHEIGTKNTIEIQ